MILERRVQIGLRRVAGIPRLREQAQIRQFKFTHELRLFAQFSGSRIPLKGRMNEHSGQKKDACQ